MKTIEKVKIVPIKPKFSQATVERLEEVLKLAKDGEIKNVFIIAEFYDGSDPMFVEAGEREPLQTLGLLDWAKARWRELSIATYECTGFDEDDDSEA